MCPHKHSLSPGFGASGSHLDYGPVLGLMTGQRRAIASFWGPHPKPSLLVFPGPDPPGPAEALREATWGPELWSWPRTV